MVSTKSPSRLPSTLVPEVLEMVVQHVDDRFTLHSLVCTSRLFFEAAVPRLYADPFRYTRYSPRACMKLFRWILTISPSTRPEVEAIRRELGIVQQPYQAPVGSPSSNQSSIASGPLVDYLSHVRHAKVQFSDFIDIEINRSFKKMMTPILPWAICDEGHFNNLVSMSVVSAQADKFLASVPSMTNLKSIYWDPTPYDKSRDMAAIRRFVEAFVEAHHERDGRKLNMYFECDVEDREDKMNFVIPELVDIYRLLDPLPPSKNSIMTSNSWMRCLAHKDKMDFGKIQKIDMIPDKELLSILPRCHKLESLSCGLGVLNSRLFRWAAGDSDNTPSCAADDDSPPPPVMPLKRLKTNVRRSIVKMTLRDVRKAFDSTLEDLELTIVKPTLGLVGVEEDDEDDGASPEFFGSSRVIRLGSELNLPKIRRLVINGTGCQCFLVLDPDTAFNNMLHLETLSIEDPSSSFSDPERLSSDLPSDASTTSLGTMTFDQLQLIPCDAWYMPRLRELELHGASAAQFHPETLQWSPGLQRLVLNMKSTYLKIPRLRSNWTERSWAWHLPSLRSLVLSGPGVFLINLAALQMHMPSLEDLTLVVGNTEENTGSLGGFLKRGDRVSTGTFTTSPLSHPLRRLRFKGRWKMMSLDLVSILDKGLFSELAELWIAHIPWILADLAIDRASHHPTLGLFWMCTRGGYMDTNARNETIKSLKLFPLKDRPKRCPPNHLVIGLDRKWYMKSCPQPTS
ncbi:hypothetical protein BGW41_004904 [Actinomortierella wolfii]|nr:hypothetical protein BGW41_004904 [Actinomortierella wolfii]